MWVYIMWVISQEMSVRVISQMNPGPYYRPLYMWGVAARRGGLTNRPLPRGSSLAALQVAARWSPACRPPRYVVRYCPLRQKKTFLGLVSTFRSNAFLSLVWYPRHRSNAQRTRSARPLAPLLPLLMTFFYFFLSDDDDRRGPDFSFHTLDFLHNTPCRVPVVLTT